MLVLSRHEDESIVIDLRHVGLGLVRVTPVDVHGNRVRLGIEADRSIPVHRSEIFDSVERERTKRAA